VRGVYRLRFSIRRSEMKNGPGNLVLGVGFELAGYLYGSFKQLGHAARLIDQPLGLKHASR